MTTKFRILPAGSHRENLSQSRTKLSVDELKRTLLKYLNVASNTQADKNSADRRLRAAHVDFEITGDTEYDIF